MDSAQHPDAALPALLPEGRRWGQGTSSITPYLREALATRARNPVFTPGDFACVVWPPERSRRNARRKP